MCDEKIYEVSVYHSGPCGWTGEFLVRACSKEDAVQKVRENGADRKNCSITAEEIDLSTPDMEICNEPE